MRYPKDHKEETRQRILHAAGAEFRAKGFAGAGVQAVMKAAGLTHGGFYAHFRGKDDLIQATVEQAFADARAMWAEQLGGQTGATWLSAGIDFYLSDGHLTHPELGCPAAALASEVGRKTDPTRAVFTDALERWRDLVAERIHEHLGGEFTRAQELSLAANGLLVGTMALARGSTAEFAPNLLEAGRRGARALLSLPDTSTDDPAPPKGSHA